MPEVFANATPLQYLHRLGRLDWLREFYGRVVVPAAVAAELDAGRRLGAKVPDVGTVPWIEIRTAPAALEVVGIQEQTARGVIGHCQNLAHRSKRVELRSLRVEFEGDSDTVPRGDIADLTHASRRLPRVATFFVDRTHDGRTTE